MLEKECPLHGLTMVEKVVDKQEFGRTFFWCLSRILCLWWNASR